MFRKHFILFSMLVFLLGCKKKNDSSVAPKATMNLDCIKPKTLDFAELVFMDFTGNLYFQDKSDLFEQWRTDKPIPCYFNSMFDNKHFIPNDTSVADSIFQIVTYPNPSLDPHFNIWVESKRQVLMHVLIVDSNGNFVYKKNHYAGQLNSSVQARESVGGTFLGRSSVVFTTTLDLNSDLTNLSGAYFRVYYYFSTKNNARFGEGFGDIYVGQYPF